METGFIPADLIENMVVVPDSTKVRQQSLTDQLRDRIQLALCSHNWIHAVHRVMVDCAPWALGLVFASTTAKSCALAMPVPRVAQPR